MSGELFVEFRKIPRLSREVIVTEKLDGTNACVLVTEDGKLFAQSRSRLIYPDDDNYGFARWVRENETELSKLGPGHHFGEWWGAGIQRKYGLTEKRFSLFNVSRWSDAEPGEDRTPNRPTCCHVVPVLYQGPFDTAAIDLALETLRKNGSVAAPGFGQPEGIIVYHTAADLFFKKSCEHDEEPKNAHPKKERVPNKPKPRPEGIMWTGGRRMGRNETYAGPERRAA